MANCLICSPNLANKVAGLSGGSWTTTLPLPNLLDPRVKKVARTTNTSLASTQFIIDTGSTTVFSILALVNNNVSIAGKVRIDTSINSDLSSPSHDSGWFEWWPGGTIPFGTLPWGEFDWHGKPSTTASLEYTPRLLIYRFPSEIRARYIRVQIDDTANPDGFVQIGRLFLGTSWQPAMNMEWGASLQYESRSNIEPSFNGTEYADVRQSFRVVRFTLGELTEDESIGQVLRLQAQSDIHREVLFLWDADDQTYRLQRSFVGRMRALNALEYPMYNMRRSAFEIKENI